MKRLLDLLISLMILLILSPLLASVMLLVKLTSTGPVFFKQQRIGKCGSVFEIYKFRTMTNRIRDFSLQVTNETNEVTFIGKVIRRLKVDELPQLFNVLKGDMSLVGPRPCLPSLVDEFNDDGRARLKVRPGLTGLAQVSGNIYLSWEERWKLDRKYVENQSLLFDLKIILRTVAVVFFGEKWGKKA